MTKKLLLTLLVILGSASCGGGGSGDRTILATCNININGQSYKAKVESVGMGQPTTVLEPEAVVEDLNEDIEAVVEEAQEEASFTPEGFSVEGDLCSEIGSESDVVNTEVVVSGSLGGVQ